MAKIVDGNTILSTWDNNNPNWVVDADGNIKMKSNLESFNYIVAPTPDRDFAFTGTFTMPLDDDGIGFVYDYQDDNNYKMFIYQGGGLAYGNPRNSIRVFHVINGVRSVYLSDNKNPFWKTSVPVIIKFETLGDTITVHLNDTLAIKYNETNFHYGRFGFVTYSQIATISSIKQVETLSNRITAKYKLYAVGNSSIDTAIEVKQYGEGDADTEIHIRAIEDSDINTFMNVMYRGNSDVLTEIQPIGYNSLETVIEVPPHNRMWAFYEVQQPPIVTDIFNPTQDAFTREEPSFQSINYGKNSSMVVGRSKDDIWRSFVQFDLSSINPSYVLKESYLRLYYKGVAPSSLKLEILNADSAWQEYSITNLNKPNPIDLIANQFTVDTKNGYIEFDVLDVVKSWVSLEKLNNGFIVRLSNENDFGQTTFHTRETMLPPELIVKYFDSRIFSQGRSQHLTEIFAYMRRHSDKLTEVTVDSVFRFETLDTEIYVHRVEVPLVSDVLTEITVNKILVATEIIATIRDMSTIPVELGVRRPREDSILTEISASRQIVVAEISSALRKDSVVDTFLAVTKPSTKVEITVPTHGSNHVFAEIDINTIWTSVVLTEIAVTRDNVAIEITPRVNGERSLQSIVTVSIPKVEVEVYVRHKNDIWVEIEPNIKSDVATEIYVTKPNIRVSVTVQGYGGSTEDAEIFVRYNNSVPTEIDAKSVSQVETIIDIKAVSQVYVEIATTKRKVDTEITIPTWADYDVLTTVEPRITLVNNIYTVIQVGAKGGAYAFII